MLVFLSQKLKNIFFEEINICIGKVIKKSFSEEISIYLRKYKPRN